MKGVLLALAFAVVATAGSYYAGVEIVPHTFGGASYGIPYLIVGWNGGSPGGFAHLGFSSPLTIDGWYMVRAGGNYDLTGQLSIQGGVSFWNLLQNFSIADGTWAVNAAVDYKFDHNLAVNLCFNIPLYVNPSAPLFGAWLTVGFRFYFGHAATAPTY